MLLWTCGLVSNSLYCLVTLLSVLTWHGVSIVVAMDSPVIEGLLHGASRDLSMVTGWRAAAGGSRTQIVPYNTHTKFGEEGLVAAAGRET